VDVVLTDRISGRVRVIDHDGREESSARPCDPSRLIPTVLLAKDFERTVAEAWVFIAHVRLLTRRFARV